MALILLLRCFLLGVKITVAAPSLGDDLDDLFQNANQYLNHAPATITNEPWVHEQVNLLRHSPGTSHYQINPIVPDRMSKQLIPFGEGQGLKRPHNEQSIPEHSQYGQSSTFSQDQQSKRLRNEATEVTSVAQTDFMSAGPTDTLEQRHNVSVGAADVTSVW
ncbi:hypothetical protein PCANC_22163 [Puccinia coronata f. sp. avenae]|uniref:Uncharacterized protein n=1 Tax=Puccinia coronata f. sp. avenae TaxID=200324 RepID=A0A2N5SIH6_9BASI|nr:hypothetical protein PCANC_22163 [Puccinia coronata f. sp. avenae]